MYTATIKEKKFVNGVLQINVSYTDGVQDFNEIYSVQSEEDIDNQISGRLKRLELAENLIGTVPLGAYTPKVKQEPIIDEKQVALSEVSRLKNLIEIGVMKDTDQEYLDAIATYKAVTGK